MTETYCNTSVNSEGVLRKVLGKSSINTSFLLLSSISEVKLAAFKMKSRNFADCFCLYSYSPEKMLQQENQ